MQQSNYSLANRITDFLHNYASISPSYDPLFDDYEDRFTGPDASELFACSNLIAAGQVPDSCSSSWESGCYTPYTSAEGRKEHDQIISEIRNLRK